jgi:N-acetylglucosamine-6-phosphate deacetylase
MNSGEIQAMHYATRRPLRVKWSDGVITSIERPPAAARASDDATARWIAPALFDVQVNGYGGVDFQQDKLSREELLAAVRALRRDGCAQFFFTLISAKWSTLLTRFRRARELRASSPELSSAIAGWHIEGPFLSDKPGFCGAHDPVVMLDPTTERICELKAVAGSEPLLLTIAPERNGAIEAVRLAASLGIKVSLGHTNAPVEVLREAVRAGATGFTHLANGCPRELDRHDNILWRVCETPGLTVSFIPDTIHVSPAPFRLLHRLLDARVICYTTDAMAAAGAPPGRYNIGSLKVEVGEDQIVRQPGKTNFAGSALRPFQGVFRAARMLDASWHECWRRASEAPARFVSLRNELAVGIPATFCVLTLDEHQQLKSLHTYAAGEAVGLANEVNV